MDDAYRFGEWLVEPRLNRLSKNGHVRHLQPLAMDVLGYLLVRRGEVVSPRELLDRVWSGRHGDVAMVKKRIGQIRRALGDDVRHPMYIETISKRGYRAIASVSVDARTEKGGPGVQPGAGETAIAVLPLVHLGQGVDRDCFCERLAEDLIDRLARDEALKVIACPASYRFNSQNDDVRDIGRQLGVTHVVSGSARRGGKQVRVSLQLVRSADGAIEWTGRYDRHFGAALGFHDEIVEKVAAALLGILAPRVTKPSPAPDVYDDYLID